ncbi:LysR family transcriptional regulator [Neisseria perflava]|uniref:LysR family transcriptional regulator n=1 Tax=Neisseria perflava TaxID=33053 RepID=UPI00209CBC30|nr:LysR family transcriptional regulator [Neisseria perflava]MCP1661048.1 DNA-binding transcriptional LysR family regulator [Neisseria perflava]MCP1772327.1 DNA-binding transcriptional LysR family regulator [Neisseria perflava]
MLNRFEALKIFCSAADTLQFKETAHRLAVSPSVVSRVISELEDDLGEPLFIRSTRQVQLTDFGSRFFARAKALLDESEQLFASSSKLNGAEMAGTVRITIPEIACDTVLLAELMQALRPYPEIVLDWRLDNARLNVVTEKIDIGLRVGVMEDSNLIARRLGQTHEKIVASPEYVRRYGLPADVSDLQRRFPLSEMMNGNTGRFWPWRFQNNVQFSPYKTGFISSDIHSNLQAALSGVAAVQLLEWACRPYLQRGELVELLPDLPKIQWPVYLYRPQQTVTPARIKRVFDLLAEILQTRFFQQEILL